MFLKQKKRYSYLLTATIYITIQIYVAIYMFNLFGSTRSWPGINLTITVTITRARFQSGFLVRASSSRFEFGDQTHNWLSSRFDGGNGGTSGWFNTITETGSRPVALAINTVILEIRSLILAVWDELTAGRVSLIYMQSLGLTFPVDDKKK